MNQTAMFIEGFVNKYEKNPAIVHPGAWRELDDYGVDELTYIEKNELLERMERKHINPASIANYNLSPAIELDVYRWVLRGLPIMFALYKAANDHGMTVSTAEQHAVSESHQTVHDEAFSHGGLGETVRDAGDDAPLEFPVSQKVEPSLAQEDISTSEEAATNEAEIHSYTSTANDTAESEPVEAATIEHAQELAATEETSTTEATDTAKTLAETPQQFGIHSIACGKAEALVLHGMPAIVALPIQFRIKGQKFTVSIEDARALQESLSAAIAVATEHQDQVVRSTEDYLVLASAKHQPLGESKSQLY